MIEADASSSIKDLRFAIEKEFGIVLSQQRLIVKGENPF